MKRKLFLICKPSPLPLLIFLLLLATDLHAGWSWTYPFYFEETAPVSLPIQTRQLTQPAKEISPPPVTTQPKADRSGTFRVTPDITTPVVKQPGAATPVPEPLVVVPPPRVIAPPRTMATFSPGTRIGVVTFTEDQEWQGEVLLEGWVTVASQATLTIRPGTVIRMGTSGGLHILGRLAAQGAPESPILLTSLFMEPLPSDWQGIVFTGTQKSNTLEHVRIEGAETGISARFSSLSARHLLISGSTSGVRLQDATVFVDGGGVTGCTTALQADYSDVELRDTAFEQNRSALLVRNSALFGTGVTLYANSLAGLVAEQSRLRLDRSHFVENEIGARISGSEGSISGTVFKDSRETGMELASSRIRVTGNLFSGNKIGLQLGDSLTAIWGNSIVGNRLYNILYLGDELLFLGGNHLGTASAVPPGRTVFSKKQGLVRVEPLLPSSPVSLD